MGKKQIREFENSLDALQAQIGLCRQGIDETFLVDGFAWYRTKLEGVRRDLEALGLYEQCRDALSRAEALVKLGPEHEQLIGTVRNVGYRFDPPKERRAALEEQSELAAGAS